MKEHKLPNGKVLRFPDNTPDSVIQATAKRIMNSKSDIPWTTEQVKAVVSEITAKNAEAVLDKNKIDNFGPAIEKLIVTIARSVDENLSKTKKIHETNNQALLKALDELAQKMAKKIAESSPDYSEEIEKASETVAKTLAKEIATVSANIEASYHVLTKNIASLVTAMNKNTEAVSGLAKAQSSTLDMMDSLVQAVRAKKKIVRDAKGNITAVDVE